MDEKISSLRFSWLEPPQSLGEMTIVEVHKAGSAQEHKQTARNWANLMCFDLSSPIGVQDFMAVQWDPQTKQLSRPETFWGFLKRFAIGLLN